MELGLFQADVARMFNVSADCITYWENNRSEPQINYYPLIIEFLGYFPLHIDLSTIHGKIKAYRYRNGLSYKRFGKVLSVDAGPVGLWENEKRTPSKEKIKIIELLIETEPPD